MFAVVALSIVESQLHHVPAVTSEPLLATVFGGLLLGAGVGTVIRHGGALDGTEILGILLTKNPVFCRRICDVFKYLYFRLGRVRARLGTSHVLDPYVLYCF